MRLWILLFLILAAGIAQAQAKYEPPDGRVLHGLGQYVPILYSDAENWQLVAEYQNATNQVPVIYSVYAALDPYYDALDHTDFIDITQNHGYPYLLLVGLTLFDSTYVLNGTIHVPVQEILNGSLDYRIIDIAQRIKAVDVPVFVRPGYEFGHGNYGIHNDPNMTPQDFIDVWIYIHDIFQQQGVTNVAWVWNTVNPDQFNYMAWYPGDHYVDWWGINYFTRSQINHSDAFLDSALAHGKPVMICESCPIHRGGTTNPSNWNRWFNPYFNKILNTPHIKAFIYISDPWDRGPFSSWADSRIDANAYIQNCYAQVLTDSTFIHLDEYINNPSIIGDETLPVFLEQFQVVIQDQGNLLQWRTGSEINHLGFNIYRAYSPESLTISDLSFQRINPQLIEGQGSVNQSTDYDYLDPVSAPGYYAYKLEFVSLNGDKEYSAPVFVLRAVDSHDSTARLSSLIVSEPYPNPFNSETTVYYQLFRPTSVTIRVFDLQGKSLFDHYYPLQSAGLHQITIPFDKVSSGLYLLTITVDHLTVTRKMLFIK